MNDAILKRFTDKCKVCSGTGKYKGKACLCYGRALYESILDSAKIDPDVKALGWSSYKGFYKDYDNQSIFVDEHLDHIDICKRYCFGDDTVEDLKNKKPTLKPRQIKSLDFPAKKDIRISRRIKECTNILIAGEANLGKTLLASLIFKTAVMSNVFGQIENPPEWVNFRRVLQAIDMMNKEYAYLTELSYSQFLFIDSIKVPENKAQVISMFDGMIGERMSSNRPTIITAGEETLLSPLLIGQEFENFIHSQRTIVLHLKQEN